MVKNSGVKSQADEQKLDRAIAIGAHGRKTPKLSWPRMRPCESGSFLMKGDILFGEILPYA